MKMLTKHTLAVAALAFVSGSLRAEEPPAPLPPASMPNQPSGLPLPAPAPIPSIPSQPTAAPAQENPPPLPLVPQPLPGIASTPPLVTGTVPVAPGPVVLPKLGTAEQLRMAIRIRELKTRVLNSDPEVNAQLDLANHARTSNGRRAAMRNYYALLYTRIEKLDPTLTPAMEHALFRRLIILEPNRVAPAPLIEPIAELPGSHFKDHLAGAAVGGADGADFTLLRLAARYGGQHHQHAVKPGAKAPPPPTAVPQPPQTTGTANVPPPPVVEPATVTPTPMEPEQDEVPPEAR